MKAPHITRLIDWCNIISKWVATEILSNPTRQGRVKRIKKMIKIALVPHKVKTNGII
jgi:hypothetical protein